MSEVPRSDSLSLTQGTKATRSEAGTTTKDVPKSTEKLISTPTSEISDATTDDVQRQLQEEPQRY